MSFLHRASTDTDSFIHISMNVHVPWDMICVTERTLEILG